MMQIAWKLKTYCTMNCDYNSFGFLKIFCHMTGSAFVISSVLHGGIWNSQVINQLQAWGFDVIQSDYTFVPLYLEGSKNCG